MNNLQQWAIRHHVGEDALAELQIMLGIDEPDYEPENTGSKHELAVQNQIRLEASRQGMRLWRNNNGVAFREDGVPIRYGLCNDTKAMNQKIKSSDLIGIRPVVITQEMVGSTIGQFVALEVKRSDWQYKNTEREQAQFKFISLVISLGGEARFINNVENL